MQELPKEYAAKFPHAARAFSLFMEGYNCAQAVFLAFSDLIPIDRDMALRLSSSFGAGMGRMREVCGAVSGMLMVAGVLYGTSDPLDREAKALHYARVQELANHFKERNGSIICRELLGERAKGSSPVPSERTATYYKTRPCARMVTDAAELLEAYIAAHPVG